MGVAVGIDLGTTNSCVAVVQGDRATVVADQNGRRIHPSIVSYLKDGSILAGHKAKDRLIINAENTIYSFKRLLGRDFKSGEMQRVLSGLPYDVSLGPGDIPAIKVHGREVSLPEVSAMMLRHVRTNCSKALGIDINEAVITVPANFSDVQRSSTKVAGRIAGFNVLRILNEPTAAALAYGVGADKSERIAIYDFGGGTFDITIVEVSDDIFEVLATAGDTFLGGDDFDNAVLLEMRTQFKKKHKVDIAADHVASQRMRAVAEQIKCQLSSIDEVQATLRQIATDKNGKPIDFDFKMDRPRFEKLTSDLVSRSLEVCDEALDLAGVAADSLDALILVGGSTRIPLVREQVSQYFGQEPLSGINPDEVVAIGAAIQAFSLTGEQLDEDIDLPAPAPKKKKPVSTLPPGAPAPHKPMNDPGPMFPSIPGESPLKEARPFGSTPAPRGDELPGGGAMVGSAPPPLKTPELKRSTLPQKVEPELSGSDDLDFSNVNLEVDDETMVGQAAKEQSDKWPAVLGTPSGAAPREPSFDESPGETESGADAQSGPDDSESWFGVLEDLPMPGAEGDTVSAVSAPVSVAPDSGRSFATNSLDDKSDLAPPPVGGPPPSSPPPVPSVGSPSASPPSTPSPPRVPSEPPAGETYPIRSKPALLLDVTPRGLGVATAGGFYDMIIERNAAIPVEHVRLFTTSSDNQVEVAVDIYQGEANRVDQNTKLGEILLTNLRPAHRGEIKIKVTFEIDTDGILGVYAANEETGEAQSTRIALSGTLDDASVEELVKKYAQ